MDQSLLQRLVVDPNIFRSINRSTRKAGYRTYLRKVLIKYLNNDDNRRQYISEHLDYPTHDDIAYWIYEEHTASDPNKYVSDGSYMCFNAIIGTSSRDCATVYSDEGPLGYSQYDQPDTELRNYLDDEEVVVIRIGYASLYNMAMEAREDIVDEEEIPLAFAQELKTLVLTMLDEDYAIYLNTNELYAWLYYNCYSLGLDEDKLSIDASSLYQLLRRTLDDSLLP